MTVTLSDEHRRNARAVYTQILLKPETHKQDIWINEGRTVDSCGTTACVAGWSAMLDPRNDVVREKLTPYPGYVSGDYYARIVDRASGKTLDVSDAGERSLGLDQDYQGAEGTCAADWLFAAERTRDEVLVQLNSMAAIGEFNWNLVDPDERYEDGQDDW